MTTSHKDSAHAHIGGKIWGLFGSLKFTLFILLSLAIISIIGTVIQQNKPPELYMAEYGNWWASLILHLGLDDMYHTRWFSILLILLVTNITVCTLDRFPPKWKSMLANRGIIDTKFMKNPGKNHTIILQDDPAVIKERTLTILRKKRYKIKEIQDKDGILLYAWKGIVGRFGSDITHVSLLLILSGTLIGNVFGFKDFGAFYEGEVTTIPVPELQFTIDRSWYGIPLPKLEQRKRASEIQLRLDKFWIDYYETGQTKQYNSILTIHDGGKEVIKGKQIWVNEPLSYKGLTFYQSSYGTAYDRVKRAEFFLRDKKTKKTIVPPFAVDWNTPSDIPGTDYRIKIIAFVSDFAFDPTTRTIFTKSVEHNNPAIQVEIYKAGKVISRLWLFYNYADFFETIPDSHYGLVFQGYQGIVYTGLSINKDPGTIVVWLGSVLMSIGFFVAFFIFYKRIWIYVKRNSNETEVHIDGAINKNKFIFERELSEIAESIKTNPWGGART